MDILDHLDALADFLEVACEGSLERIQAELDRRDFSSDERQVFADALQALATEMGQSDPLLTASELGV